MIALGSWVAVKKTAARYDLNFQGEVVGVPGEIRNPDVNTEPATTYLVQPEGRTTKLIAFEHELTVIDK